MLLPRSAGLLRPPDRPDLLVLTGRQSDGSGLQSARRSTLLMMSTKAQARILIADPHSARLVEMVRLLARHYSMVAALSSPQLLAEVEKRLDPHLIVLDLSMLCRRASEVPWLLNPSGRRSKLVLLIGEDDSRSLNPFQSIFPNGFIAKSRLALDLLPVTSAVLAGGTFSPSFDSPQPLVLAKAAATNGGGTRAMEWARVPRTSAWCSVTGTPKS